jgi:hypothetical protein
MIQLISKNLFGNLQINTPNFEGAYSGLIFDTDFTNTDLQAGNCRIQIPMLDPKFVWPESPYPGAWSPPNGTKVSVVFNLESSLPVIIGYLGHSTGYFRSGVGAPSADIGNIGDYYIDTASKTFYGPKKFTRSGSPPSIITTVVWGTGIPL